MEKTSVVYRQRFKRRARRVARRVLPFMASLFMATPLASPVLNSKVKAASVETKLPSNQELQTAFYNQRTHKLYEEMALESQGLRFEVFEKALTGYLNLQTEGRLSNEKQLLTVVDFELPSTEKRLWVLDLAAKQVKFHTLVAHGHNSGEDVATTFSNQNESNMSSLGFYVTQDEYIGKHGRSLKLDGMDEGFNTNALERSVVMHGADYVSEDFIKQNGRLGRSLGCPALPMDQKDEIIEAVNGGTCLFLSGADQSYSSKYLNQDVAINALLSSNS
ncbi:murein L,D-transpeptidase catalytic domain family protein [Hymenobacter sp. BT186]|uniref:Murein L,D-transpeptidase catalytic domain family protein n=1 Tax=Hymenobacter telluris TaxID=2816474 RepID=A0A939JCD6_9BACT|nr:murein L,D-transpeptidase catalytic domain family protein [Hymenobacter telluris]MBO0357192.1 murein L,D-transpeptidase catalytic domain family protein [Hymenobacter telluris]MBW3373218.1 murein L,D-transpeptidase catalytic domain family protein [Hymenobacter norwichensis]